MVALGYSMVYGVLQIVNWAHADVLMFGTFIGMLLTTALHMPVLAMVFLAASFTALLGMGVERLAYRPIKSSNRSIGKCTWYVDIFTESCTADLWNRIQTV